MSTHDDTHEFVSVSEAATRLGISPTTVRERIRAGQLEAERVNRPQGTVFQVKVPVLTRPTNAEPESTPEDAQTGTEDAQVTHGYERAGADMIAAAVAPLVERLIVADRQIAEQAQTIKSQAQTIADLREERGTLAERAEQERIRTEDERARAMRAESERDAVRVELATVREAREAAILAAQSPAAPVEPAVPMWRRWWPLVLGLAGFLLIVALLVWSR